MYFVLRLKVLGAFNSRYNLTKPVFTGKKPSVNWNFPIDFTGIKNVSYRNKLL